METTFKSINVCECCGSLGKWDDFWEDYELWVLFDKQYNEHSFCPRCYDNQCPSCCERCGDWFITGCLSEHGYCPQCAERLKEKSK